MYVTILETKDKKKGIIVLDDNIREITSSLEEWLKREKIKYGELNGSIILNRERKVVVGRIDIVKGKDNMATSKLVNYYG